MVKVEAHAGDEAEMHVEATPAVMASPTVAEVWPRSEVEAPEAAMALPEGGGAPEATAEAADAATMAEVAVVVQWWWRRR